MTLLSRPNEVPSPSRSAPFNSSLSSSNAGGKEGTNLFFPYQRSAELSLSARKTGVEEIVARGRERAERGRERDRPFAVAGIVPRTMALL